MGRRRCWLGEPLSSAALQLAALAVLPRHWLGLVPWAPESVLLPLNNAVFWPHLTFSSSLLHLLLKTTT